MPGRTIAVVVAGDLVRRVPVRSVVVTDSATYLLNHSLSMLSLALPWMNWGKQRVVLDSGVGRLNAQAGWEWLTSVWPPYSSSSAGRRSLM
ncbi:hypothetical protein [Streptomyces sp. NPDC015125]|uniref:hypothetical protein n=1 Tax=Streptomyces sp. NPDC015125 TaxID=3364938 RepID=UPI0036FB71EB